MNGAPSDDVENEAMIREQIAGRGIRDERVLSAMRSVPRALFVPSRLRSEAYADTPLPLDQGQTISQPFIVALMTELLRLRGDESVLEIGTGSGYQTAVLARLCRHVWSAELEPVLSSTVHARLDRLGISNVTLRIGDGVRVFRDHAPFDRILSAAAAPTIPEPLIDQLADDGRAILPVGVGLQHLWLIEKHGGKVERHQLDAVRFVPLRTGDED